MSKLVEMLKDVYPYCKGDVVRLEDDELKRVAKSDENGPAYKDLAVVARAEAAQEAEIVEQPAEEVKAEGDSAEAEAEAVEPKEKKAKKA